MNFRVGKKGYTGCTSIGVNHRTTMWVNITNKRKIDD